MTRETQMLICVAASFLLLALGIVWGLIILLKNLPPRIVQTMTIENEQVVYFLINDKPGRYLVLIRTGDEQEIRILITPEYMTVYQSKFLPPDVRALFQKLPVSVTESELKEKTSM